MKFRGLYAITAAARAAEGGLAVEVRGALAGGARILQYRDKGADRMRRTREARALQALCLSFGVPLIINDDIELAAAIGAAGVHLGRDDTSIAIARRRLGAGAIIGVSCYNDFSRAVAARLAGADYVAFGSFFASPTKPHAARADVGLLARARAELALPVVAIGGITPENGAELVAAGADMLAVIDGVFGQPHVEAAARRYARLFEPDPETEE